MIIKPQQAVDWLKRHPIWLILLLGLCMRLIMVNSRDLQYDDAFSILLAQRSISEIISGTAADTMPPLFYFILHYWLLISKEVWFIRLLTIILSLGLILILIWLAEQWLDRRTAYIAGLIAAFSPLHLYHAQDVRMYTLLVLGQLGFAAFFTRIWFSSAGRFKERMWDWVGMVLSGLVAMYSHNLAIFGVVAIIIIPLLFRKWRLLLRVALSTVIIMIGSLPWLMFLPGQLEKIQKAFWTPRPGLVEVFQSIILYMSTLPLSSGVLLVVSVLCIQILVIGLLEIRRYVWNNPGLLFFTCILIIPPGLLFITSYLMRPVFVTRGFLISSIAFYVLVGYVVAKSWDRVIGKFLLGAYGLVILISLPYHFLYNSFPRSPVSDAVVYLSQVSKPGDQIVHETKLSYFPALFYRPELPQVFIADEPGSANDTLAPATQAALGISSEPDLPSAINNKDRVFFVTYSQVFFEYQEAGFTGHPGVRYLLEKYDLIERKAFNDLEIFFFER